MYEGLFIWSLFKQLLETMISLKIQNQDTRNEEIPEYLEAVSRLKVLLDLRMIHKGRKELMRRFPTSPPFRGHYYRSLEKHSLCLRNEEGPQKDSLWWLLYEMRDDDSRIPKDILAIELNTVVQNDKRQKEKITPFVARVIEDLSLAYEFRRQLKLLCPQVFRVRSKILVFSQTKDQETMESVMPDLQPATDLLLCISVPFAGDKLLKLGAEGNPASGRVYYPAKKRRTKENNEAMQIAERNLDKFWQKLDNHVRKHVSQESFEALNAWMPKKEEIQ